jgi:transcriptional regulator
MQNGHSAAKGDVSDRKERLRPPAGRRGMSAAFERHGDADLRDLIADYPLAWVVARGSSTASLLPLLGEYDGEGRLVSLLGHMGRRNALFATLAADPAATILFNGPNAYVSPDHAERRDWGPTWNYAQATVAAEVTFLPEAGDEALARLVDAMERGRWTHEELGARYAGMAQAIVAFRARVTGVEARFKLGQDEAPEVFEAICRNHPDAALVRWMRRFAR